MTLRSVPLIGSRILLTLVVIILHPGQPVHGQVPALPSHVEATPTTLPRQARLAGYPELRQQHTLSCEAAAVSMATHGHLSEHTILAHMPLDPDPWLGFRGNVDGGQTLANGLANYGIYAPPLAHEVESFGYQSVVITGTAAPALLRYSIGVLRQPVVVWITHYLGDWPAITGHAGGRSFTLIDGEHARLAVGYDTRGIYTLDPLEGPRYDPWPIFLHSWARFEYMGLLVAASLPRPATPIIQVQHLPGLVHWSWTQVAGPLADQVTLFRLGRPLRQMLLTTAARPPGTLVLGDTRAVTGTVLPSSPPLSVVPDTAVLSATQLLAAPAWYSGSITLQVQLAYSVPYTLTVRSVDPLGLMSAVAVSPIALDSVPSPPPPVIPPPIPTMVRASIAGPRQVRWTWPVGDGRTYRVVSYRYRGSHPVDYIDLTLGHRGAFTRMVQQEATYYAQVLAIGSTGLSSPATPPIPAPILSAVRLLRPIEARLQGGGYGEWSWAVHGAVRYLIQSYAYAGPHVVALQRMSTSATTYHRWLTPGLGYQLQVIAVANDGEQTGPYVALRTLIYHPGDIVQQLRKQ